MVCNKCGSEKVSVQRVSTTKRKRNGWSYWLLFGWLIDLLLWVFLTLPRLLIALFVPKKTKTVVHTEAVCQNCGHSWEI